MGMTRDIAAPGSLQWNGAAAMVDKVEGTVWGRGRQWGKSYAGLWIWWISAESCAERGKVPRGTVGESQVRAFCNPTLAKKRQMWATIECATWNVGRSWLGGRL